MIIINKVSKTFGKQRALENVSFNIHPNTITGLIGPSGAGKSALLKILGGVYATDSGSIDWGHINSSQVSLLFQEGALFDSLDVYENVAFPIVKGQVPTFLLSRSTQVETYEEVAKMLARVGLSKAIHKTPEQLSGGMRRRASLARALVNHPELVLLDDPTSGLDPVASSVIMELIVELQIEYELTMLVVSQDLRRLLPIVDQVCVLWDGRQVFSGPTTELGTSAPAAVKEFIACRYDLEKMPGLVGRDVK